METNGKNESHILAWAERALLPEPERDGLASILADAIQEHLPAPALDETAIRTIVKDEMGGDNNVKHITVARPDGSTVDVGRQHPSFDLLLTVISTGEATMMVGPAGSGKTTAARAIARALDQPFFITSVGPTSSAHELFGYQDAAGNYHRTGFRESWEHGGVFLLDEMDAGNPGILTVLNACVDASPGETIGFPDGQIPRSDQSYYLAACNTYGRGADRDYVGRNQLDGATVDRFSILDWDVDEKLESDLWGNPEWAQVVQAVRRSLSRHKIRHIISPRATRRGAKFIAAGLDASDITSPLWEMVIWRGLEQSARNKVVADLAQDAQDAKDAQEDKQDAQEDQEQADDFRVTSAQDGDDCPLCGEGIVRRKFARKTRHPFLACSEWKRDKSGCNWTAAMK